MFGESVGRGAHTNVSRTECSSLRVTSPRKADQQSRLHLLGAFTALSLLLTGQAPWAALASAADDAVLASFRFNAEADGVLVPVAFGEESRLFILDTGSTVSVFDRSLRATLGEPGRVLRAEATDGAMRVQLFRPPRISIGGLGNSDLSRVACIDLAEFRAIGGIEMYGIAGMDLLARRIIRINFDTGKVDFLRYVPEDSGTEVTLTLPRGVPQVSMTVAGAGEVAFTIATGGCGYRAGDIDRKFVDRLLKDGNAARVSTAALTFGLAAGTTDTCSLRLKEIGLSGFVHRGAVFSESAKNLLGLGYLSRYIVTFDFPGKKMYLKPGARFNEPSRDSLSGAQFRRPDGKTMVQSVDAGSASEAGGLKAGDVIEEIDARDAATLTMLQIRKKLCVAGKHTLRVTRGGKRLIITLNLVDSVVENRRGETEAAKTSGDTSARK